MGAEKDYDVIANDDEITMTGPAGQAQTLRWVDLGAVYVETSETGPWGLDVWWVLYGPLGAEVVRFPLGATGEESALAAFRRRLPGFTVAGMNSTRNAQHLCWQRG